MAVSAESILIPILGSPVGEVPSTGRIGVRSRGRLESVLGRSSGIRGAPTRNDDRIVRDDRVSLGGRSLIRCLCPVWAHICSWDNSVTGWCVRVG